MLQVRGLVKTYKRVLAVDNLDFEVRPGEIVGLLGPNGAGKTSALRCVSGILRPTSGTATINGFDIVAEQAKAKSGLAFVPEVPNLYELLTVDEHLRFVAMCFDRLDRYEALANELFERYALSDKKHALVATLSKGMRQKLSIACAMVHDANVLVMDEPIVGIDPAGVAEFKAEILRCRAEGAAILVSTHLLDTAEKLCDRVVILAKGRKVAEGTLSELREGAQLAQGDLEQVFLKLTNPNHDASPVLPL